MVCLGNICRSPLAHGLLQSKLSKAEFYIDSAGTAAYHIGNPPDYRSIQVAKHHGLDISAQSARQFRALDFDTFDHIYAMDQSNYKNIIDLARTSADKGKVKLFLDINTSITHKDVPDPYHGTLSDFESIYNLIDGTCDQLVRILKN